jgi:hypothetical protein
MAGILASLQSLYHDGCTFEYACEALIMHIQSLEVVRHFARPENFYCIIEVKDFD